MGAQGTARAALSNRCSTRFQVILRRNEAFGSDVRYAPAVVSAVSAARTIVARFTFGAPALRACHRS